MPDSPAEYDVAIVGYGPVGALAANLLGARGHRVLALDSETGIYPLPRAIHMDAEIMRVLQAAGLADDVVPLLVGANECQFVTAEREVLFREVSDAAQEPYGWPQRLLFRQPELEAELRRGVSRYPNVTVSLGQNVTAFTQDETWVTLSIQGAGVPSRQVRARYVLGCDGARSVMRRLSGVQYRQMAEFRQPWLVVDTFLDSEDAPLPRVMTQLCDPARPTTFIPRVGTLERRWEFYLRPDEDPARMQQLEQVRELLRPWIDPDRVTIERSAVYTFRALIAERWRVGRVLLVGDAAHLMPPFLGQGLGSGVRDAHNLVWKLDLVLRGLADDALLASYEQERSPHVRRVTQVAVAAGKFIMERHPVLHRLRDTGLLGLNRSSRLNREFPLPGLRGGVMLPGSAAAGTRFIQPRVSVPGGQAPVLLDDVLGDTFALLGWNTDPRGQLELDMPGYWDRLGTTFIQVLPAGTPFPITPSAAHPGRLQLVRDDTGALAAWFSHHRASAVAVRPDRYVYGTFGGKPSRGRAGVTRTLSAALHPPRSTSDPGLHPGPLRLTSGVDPRWLIGAGTVLTALVGHALTHRTGHIQKRRT